MNEQESQRAASAAAREGPPPPGWVRRALIGRNPKVTLVRALVLAALCFIILRYVAVPIRVEGISMAPTYKSNSINFVNRLVYKFREPRRGEVVAIQLAGPHLMYMKRIIGLPGETVSFHRGRAYINGQPLEEPYVKYDCNWECAPVLVGPDQFYVVGDNRSMAEADHEKGRPNRKKILGKVIL